MSFSSRYSRRRVTKTAERRLSFKMLEGGRSCQRPWRAEDDVTCDVTVEFSEERVGARKSYKRREQRQAAFLSSQQRRRRRRRRVGVTVEYSLTATLSSYIPRDPGGHTTHLQKEQDNSHNSPIWTHIDHSGPTSLRTVGFCVLGHPSFLCPYPGHLLSLILSLRFFIQVDYSTFLFNIPHFLFKIHQ
jgi:hypothetical protein